MKLSILALATVAAILHAAPKSAASSPANFYTQSVDADGVTIRASSKVEKATIEAVRSRVVRVLANAPGIAANLRAAKAEMHVYARTEVITDLPEFQAFRGHNVPEGVTWEHRFHGGNETGMLIACSEENVMRDKSNPYPKDYDVCTHELAHSVFDIGLDVAAREKVIARYQAALDENLYVGTYAGKSFAEFFAEGSARYFGYSGGGLRDSDPTTFALFDSFYRGRYAPLASPVTDLNPLSSDAVTSARSTFGGGYTSGLFLKNKSRTDVRATVLDTDGRPIATRSSLIIAGGVDALAMKPGSAVILTDDKTKGTLGVVSIPKDYGRIAVDDKMVRAQKAPTPEQLAATHVPTEF